MHDCLWSAAGSWGDLRVNFLMVTEIIRINHTFRGAKMGMGLSCIIVMEKQKIQRRETSLTLRERHSMGYQ